jgi:hypothetical protein
VTEGPGLTSIQGSSLNGSFNDVLGTSLGSSFNDRHRYDTPPPVDNHTTIRGRIDE